jgi:hypothetical protein
MGKVCVCVTGDLKIKARASCMLSMSFTTKWLSALSNCLLIKGQFTFWLWYVFALTAVSLSLSLSFSLSLDTGVQTQRFLLARQVFYLSYTSSLS